MGNLKKRVNLRFKFSEAWLSSNPHLCREHLSQRRGTVLYEASGGNSWVVQFDGRTARSYYAKTFIEIIEAEPATTASPREIVLDTVRAIHALLP